MKSKTGSEVDGFISRRYFIGTAAKAVSAAALGPSLFSIGTAFAAGPFVRPWTPCWTMGGPAA